ncbi:MAG: hypothetical protein U0Y08_13035 [Bacteroidia bacterium]
MYRSLYLVFFILSVQVTAQPTFDVAQASFMQANATRHGDKTANDLRYYSGELNLPITWNRRNITVIDPMYEWHRFTVGEDSLKTHQDLHDYTFFLNHRLALKDTTHFFLFAAGLRHYAETGIHPGSSTLTPAFAIIYGHQVNAHFSWQAGGYYSREFFGNYWLPLLGYEWRASKRLWTWGILPKFAVVDYAITRSLHACFFYKGVTDSYRVHQHDYFAWIEGQARLGFEYYLPHLPVAFTMDVGQSAAREYFAYDEVSKSEHELLPANGFIFHAGIQLRVITNKDFYAPQIK